MKGRRPTPTAILHASGAFRSDRHGKRQDVLAEVKAGTLRRPKWLTERGALHWKSTVATLRDLRLDAEPYSLAAGLLANQLGWYAYTTSPQAMEDLGDALAIREQGKAFDRLVKIGRELGLSPTSIASAQSPAKEQPKNGLDALILRENEGQLKIAD